jgi:hypothetical protein
VAIDCRCSARELHAFWDNVLGTSKSPQAAANAAGALPAADAQRAAIADEAVWIQESLEIAKSKSTLCLTLATEAARSS